MPIGFEEMSDVIRALPQGLYGGAGGAAQIPRRIMQFWDSPTPPAEVAELMATWAPLHPGYELVAFDDASALAWLGDRYGERYAAAYRACQHAAMKSDFFRLAYLYKCGGAYIDADERCLRAIDPLVESGANLVLNRRLAPNGLIYFNNAPLLCSPGLPLLLECLDWAADELLAARGRPLKIWVTTGPGNLSRSFAQRVVNAGELPRTLILDDWGSYSEIRFCSYKYGSRYWLTHDRFLESGGSGVKHLAGLWKQRLRAVVERQPAARWAWRTLKSALRRPA
jgi:hypothetical protein